MAGSGDLGPSWPACLFILRKNSVCPQTRSRFFFRVVSEGVKDFKKLNFMRVNPKTLKFPKKIVHG
jgi:hypothetical protein